MGQSQVSIVRRVGREALGAPAAWPSSLSPLHAPATNATASKAIASWRLRIVPPSSADLPPPGRIFAQLPLRHLPARGARKLGEHHELVGPQLLAGASIGEVAPLAGYVRTDLVPMLAEATTAR
jgi:hypothetical protein